MDRSPHGRIWMTDNDNLWRVDGRTDEPFIRVKRFIRVKHFQIIENDILSFELVGFDGK